jgi:hypothetical protein
MTTPPSPPPGWYPDPAGGPGQRYWNGTAWGEVTVGLGQSASPGQSAIAQPTKPGISTGMKIGLGVGALALAMVALGSVGSNDKSSSTTARSSSRTSISDVTPTTSKSSFTPSQDNAIESAKSYLNYTSFSKQGLIKQLQSEEFSQADATFAVEYIESSGGVDWNEQAVKSAKSYLNYTSFSLPGLIKQLESEGFMPAQAQLGANTAYGG